MSYLFFSQQVGYQGPQHTYSISFEHFFLFLILERYCYWPLWRIFDPSILEPLGVSIWRLSYFCFCFGLGHSIELGVEISWLLTIPDSAATLRSYGRWENRDRTPELATIMILDFLRFVFFFPFGFLFLSGILDCSLLFLLFSSDVQLGKSVARLPVVGVSHSIDWAWFERGV